MMVPSTQYMIQETPTPPFPEEPCSRNQKIALFEPWGLGDSIIAAAAARERPEEFFLYCSSKWHPILREACDGKVILQPAELSYTSRLPQGAIGPSREKGTQNTPKAIVKIYSIRGDPRDWLAIRRFFPGVRVRMTGWLEFLAKKTIFFDWIYRARILRVRSRYERWEQLLNLPKGAVARRYSLQRILQGKSSIPGKVIIHLGAQWKSKQYPHVDALREKTKALGFSVNLLAGPHDPLPPNINENEVSRPSVPELIRELRSADWVIANDSGPMHLAAFVGAKTIVLSLLSNIQEWLPPGVIPVCSDRMPKGHMPISSYTTDEILEGWPEPEKVIEKLSLPKMPEPNTSM